MAILPPNQRTIPIDIKVRCRWKGIASAKTNNEGSKVSNKPAEAMIHSTLVLFFDCMDFSVTLNFK